jgi:hypothetical protein
MRNLDPTDSSMHAVYPGDGSPEVHGWDIPQYIKQLPDMDQHSISLTFFRFAKSFYSTASHGTSRSSGFLKVPNGARINLLEHYPKRPILNSTMRTTKKTHKGGESIMTCVLCKRSHELGKCLYYHCRGQSIGECVDHPSKRNVVEG